MLLELGLFVGGLLVLVYGSYRAVVAAAQLGAYYGVPSFFIGVTVVAIGTSVPEMTTAVYGSVYGAGDLVVGNIVGSEVAQVTLAVGVVALIAPITADRRHVLVYGGTMVVSMVVMVLALEDGRVVRSEAALMLLAYASFVYTLYANEGGEAVGRELVDVAEPPDVVLPRIAVGLGMVLLGGYLLVTNGVALAGLLGVPELLVGLVVGLGTTVPEMSVATLAADSGRGGVSVGTLLASNVTDPVLSLGVGALAADVVVANRAAMDLSVSYMLAVSLVVLGLFYWRGGITRFTAFLCLALYLPTFLLP